MPPNASQKIAQEDQIEEKLSAAITKLCTHLRKGKIKEDEIKIANLVATIDKILKSYRKSSRTVSSDVLLDLVAMMENGGEDFCSQMNTAVFCVTIDTILQADTYIQAQRGIHLLAASLHRDSGDEGMESTIQLRKELIGKGCLQRMLAYFTDMKKDASDGLMRRWLGILCIELIRGSEENINLVIDGPDNTRRGLGQLILQEPDEIIRVLAGEIVKTLSDGGTRLEDIWPQDTIDLYEGFPQSSESQAGWAKTFSRWIDELYARHSQLVPAPVGQVFFLRRAKLSPKMRFGVAGQFLLLYITEGVMSILAPSINGNLDQLFDAPLKCFKAAYSKSDHSSQLDEVQIILELQSSDPSQTILDAVPVHLDTITILMDVHTSIQMIETIKLDCPTLDIGELEFSPLVSEPRTSWSQIPVRGEVVNSPPTGNIPSKSRQGDADEEVSPDALSLSELRRHHEDPVISLQDEDLYDATPPRSSKLKGDAKGIADRVGTIRVETAKSKGRAAIKPKAKPPITQHNRRSTSHQELVKSEVPASKNYDRPPKEEKLVEGVAGCPAKSAKSTQPQDERRPSRSAGIPKSAEATNNKKRVSQTKVVSQGRRLKAIFTEEASKVKDVSDMHENKNITSSNTHVAKSQPLGPARPHKIQKSETQRTVQPPKKRYSLNGSYAPASAPTNVDPFDIPDDPVDLSKANPKAPKPRVKTNAKTAESTAKITKKESPDAMEPSKAKKRQSAPAVLNESTLLARESKRAAAAKAKARIHNEDDSDEEFEAAITSYALSGSEPNRKLKAKLAGKTRKSESQNLTKASPLVTKIDSTQPTPNPTINDKPVKTQVKTATISAEITVNKEIVLVKEVASGEQVTKSIDALKEIVNANANAVSVSAEVETEIDRIQQDDARELGLIQYDSIPRAFDDDLPVNISADPMDKSPAEPLAQQKVNAQVKNTASSPNEAFADKLGNLLGDLADVGDELEAEGFEKTLTSGFVDNSKLQRTVQDPVITTSPFPSSSNLMEQTSPELTGARKKLGDHPQQRGAPSNRENENAEDEPTAPEQPKRLSRPANTLAPEGGLNPSPVQDPENPATKQEQEAAPPHEFRKPSIPVKTSTQKVDDREVEREGWKTHESPTKPSPRNYNAEDKAVQTSAYEMVTDDMQESGFSATEHIDGNIEYEERQNMDPKEMGKKRKSTASDNPLAKRQRKGVDQGQRVENDTISQAPEVSRGQSTQAPRSPDLPKHPRSAAEDVKRKKINESTLKDPSRKPNIIIFSSDGPLNQGKYGTVKKTTNKASEVPIAREVVERKRKRIPEKTTDEAPQSLPKKRQHSSPVQCDDNSGQAQIEEAYPMNDPVNKTSPVAASGRYARPRSNRQSSQTLRVDQNGSPVAVGDIDHIQKLKERMSQSARPSSPHDPYSTDNAPESPENNKQGATLTFAPRVELEMKEKVRTSSPQEEEVTSRYIAHERTAHGHYKGIQSQEVVAPETEMADPFKDAPGRPTPFIERLQQSSKEVEVAEVQPQGRHLAPPGSLLKGNESLTQLPRKNLMGDRRSDINNRTESNVQDDEERTLVGSGRRYGRQLSPDGMTNDSSPESRSSGQSTKKVDDRVPLGEMMWNVALRPHYATAREAIHRIADEVIIRLSDEEDRLALLVKQYDENGAKIMGRMSEKREKEKAAILLDLDSKSKEIVTVYTDAKDFIRERVHELKENPISGFEKEWKKRQDDIQKLVSSGMSSLI